MGTSAEVAGELGRHPLFSGLSNDDLAALSTKAIQRTFAPRTVVFDEGRKCEGLWVVVSGWVRLYHSSADGRQQIVAFRGHGSALQVGPALDGRQYTASATSLDELTLVFVPRATFQAVSREITVVRAVIDHLCLEVRELDTAATVSVSKDARGRICCALLRLAKQFGQGGGPGVRIQHRLTRRDIGDASGVTIETAIRVLGGLKHEGIVRSAAQVVEITDVRRLERAAGCFDCQLSCARAGLEEAAASSRRRTPAVQFGALEWKHRRRPVDLPDSASGAGRTPVAVR